MRNKPRVSLGLPVFNGEKYLEETLDSILAQTFTDFELIISDNASTDRTQAICQDYVDRDGRIRYFRNDKNLGAAPNYNRTFELSSGDYFKWVAADDLLNSEYLAHCVDVLDKNLDVVLVFTRSKMIDEQAKFIGEAVYPTDISSAKAHLRFRSVVLDLANVPKVPIVVFGLMRASEARKTGLIGNFPSSDVVLIAELALYGYFYEIPRPLFLWRHHSEQSVQGELASDRARSIWFDTSLTGKIILHKWQYLAGYLRAIKNSPIGSAAKVQCYLTITQWGLNPRNFKPLVKDLLLASRTLFIRTFSKPKATTRLPQL